MRNKLGMYYNVLYRLPFINMSMETISRLIAALVVVIAVFIVGGFAVLKYDEYLGAIDRKADLREQELKNIAIDECFQTATVVTDKGTSTLTEPGLYYYRLCMQDKGYETNVPE